MLWDVSGSTDASYSVTKESLMPVVAAGDEKLNPDDHLRITCEPKARLHQLTAAYGPAAAPSGPWWFTRRDRGGLCCREPKRANTSWCVRPTTIQKKKEKKRNVTHSAALICPVESHMNDRYWFSSTTLGGGSNRSLGGGVESLIGTHVSSREGQKCCNIKALLSCHSAVNISSISSFVIS